MYTHTLTHTLTPTRLHSELSEGVRHRQTQGCPDRHTRAVTPKPPLVLCLLEGVPGKRPKAVGAVHDTPFGNTGLEVQPEEDGRWGSA